MKKDKFELINQKLQNIKLLAFDSDGVLTDGGVYFLGNGEELRRFDIKDGMGLAQCLKVGYQVAIISGSASKPVLYRANTLNIKHVFLGVVDKLSCLQTLCNDEKIKLKNVLYMGDDLSDIAVMNSVGLACAPADAVKEVIAIADFVCQRTGGQGAVREICDKLLCFHKE